MEANAGFVVKSQGDGFMLAFASARRALRCAIGIQRTMGDLRSDDGAPVRVRIGAHTGEAVKSADDFFGKTVVLASRIAGSARGGQILVSGDTRTAARESMLDGVRFRSLGPHRLRGLPDVVPLFQVAAKGLVTRFPPPRTALTG